MKHFKHLLLTLLALTLIIRPVFAEGLMLHSGSSSSEMAEEMQTMDLMQSTDHSQMMMLHNQNHAAMDHSPGHAMGCADAGLHQCDGNCMDNNCSFISAVSAITTTANLQLPVAEQSQTFPLNHTALVIRTIPPEQRPPLV